MENINSLRGFIKKKQNEIRFKYDGDGYGYMRDILREEIYQLEEKIKNEREKIL